MPFYYSKAEFKRHQPSVWFESQRVAYVMHGDTCGQRYQSDDGQYWWRE